MRSVPVTMIWETLNKGRWSLLLGFLVANSLPIIVFSGIGRLDVIEFDEFTQQAVHSPLIQINMFLFGTGILFAQGVPSRLYAFPVTSATIVAWQMIPAMLFMGLEMYLSISFLNVAYHAGWPIWGPVLFAAVTTAAIQATLWYLEKTAWLPVGLALVPGLLGCWYFWRYSRPIPRSILPLNEVATVEVIMLLLVAFASYFIGVAGVARNRCGEQIKPLGILAWLESLVDFKPVFSPPFRSRDEAQFWFEWTLKGLGLPFIVVFGIPVVIACWLIASRDPKDLINAFVGGGAMMSGLGMVIGMIMGHAGPADVKFQMGHYLSTRPLTSSNMAFIILKVTAKSITVAWLIWLSAFAIVSGIIILSGFAPHPFLPTEVRWWYFPATLLGCWTVTGTFTSLILTGRVKELVQLACCLLAMHIGLVIYANFALSWDARSHLFQGLTIAAGISLVLCSLWLFIVARRQKLITTPIVVIAAGVWVALCSVVVVEGSRNPYAPLSNYILVIGLAALTVFPFAAAPLALSWNRNR